MKLLRYLHTIRHLRPVQIYGRVWYRLRKPTPDTHAAPGQRVRAGTWRSWSWRPSAMRSAHTFEFLGTQHHVSTDEDWDHPRFSRLWRYNLHYFDDLTAVGWEQRNAWHNALIARWIRENPPGKGTGWEPYPTSLRLVNWLKWAMQPGGGQNAGPEVFDSIATQVRWLGERLERHLLGNHLWANAKALAFAGAFFNGSEADRWRVQGQRLLERELNEQILPDGGHFERSPMYHAILLEDVLDLINLCQSYPDAFASSFQLRLRSVADIMCHWLRVMTHPDGQISFFNDAAFGIAATYADVAAYSAELGQPVNERPLARVEALPQSGYVRLQNQRAVVICDLAPVGPDYLPAHAHADTLSFECSVDGRRVFVNSGTSLYEAGPEREAQRSTAAHNTVVVDGRDSSEVWSSFRVARRARVSRVRHGSETDAAWAEGSHDGYSRLGRGTIHNRRWELREAELTITDRIDGQVQTAEARFHLHPEIAARAADAGSATLMAAQTEVTVTTSPQQPIVVGASSWHSGFGVSTANTALSVRFAGPVLVTRVSW